MHWDKTQHEAHHSSSPTSVMPNEGMTGAPQDRHAHAAGVQWKASRMMCILIACFSMAHLFKFLLSKEALDWPSSWKHWAHLYPIGLGNHCGSQSCMPAAMHSSPTLCSWMLYYQVGKAGCIKVPFDTWEDLPGLQTDQGSCAYGGRSERVPWPLQINKFGRPCATGFHSNLAPPKRRVACS